MKIKELKELKMKKADELVKLVSEKKIELTKLMGRVSTAKEKNLKKGKMIRRDIAQILTILSLQEKDMTKKGKTE